MLGGTFMSARPTLLALLPVGALVMMTAARAADYRPITPEADREIVILTWHTLSNSRQLAGARTGSRVRYSPEAIQRAADGNDLRAEAGAENIPVYGLNRGAGALREVEVKRDEITQLSAARAGAKEGVLPEI